MPKKIYYYSRKVESTFWACCWHNCISQLSRFSFTCKNPSKIYTQPTPHPTTVFCTREILSHFRGLDVFFILRAKSEGSSRWSGQVGFPGGHVELGEEEQILEFASFRFSWFGANDPGVSGGSKFTWEFSECIS